MKKYIKYIPQKLKLKFVGNLNFFAFGIRWESEKRSWD